MNRSCRTLDRTCQRSYDLISGRLGVLRIMARERGCSYLTPAKKSGTQLKRLCFLMVFPSRCPLMPPPPSTREHKNCRMLESKLSEAVLCQTHPAIESP